MASQLPRAILRSSLRPFLAAATGGLSFAASAMVLSKKSSTSPLLLTAKCMCRAPPDHAFHSELDKHGKLEQYYQTGHLTDIYEQLNSDPETSSDPLLLFHLARATYKLGLASPLPGRQKALNDEALLYIGKALQLPLTDAKVKADVHALYAIVLQNRGAKKQGSEKRKFYEAAQEHLTAALKEDRKNFLANFAFAEMNRDVAEQSSVVAVVPSSRFSLFQSQEIVAKDVETWKAVNRYAQKAVFADPNDIQSLNLLAKAKYELGDIAEAKRITVRAINSSKAARFADERKAVAETRELMEKINDHFEKEKN